MDAAYKSPKNIALFLTLTLLAAFPWRAQAQTFSSATDSVTLTGNQAQSRSVGSSDSNNPITYNVSIAYGNAGDLPWLQIGGVAPFCTAASAGPLTTPSTLTFQPGCNAANINQNITHTATVTLTATGPAGAVGAVETISVSYVPGSAGNQSLTATPSIVPITAAVGGTGSASFQLITNSSGTVSYSIAAPQVPWLTISQGAAGSVASGAPATVTLQANALSLNAGAYSATLQVQYNGTSLPVTVNLTVGSGTSNGSLTFSVNPINFSYTTNASIPPAQSTTTSSSASSYSFSVSENPNWLSVNASLTTSGATYGPYAGNTLTLQPANTSLATGNYTATITVTDANNNTGILTVNLAVNGGGTGTFTVSPNPITLSAQSGTGIGQVSVSVTPSTSGTLAASVSGLGLSIPSNGGASQSVLAGVPVTVILQGDPSALSANTYSGSLLLQIVGTAISQSYPINFVVGGGGGGSTTSTTVSPTALNFYYETGQGTSAGQLQQQITVAGPSSFTISSPVVTGSVAWLNVGSVAGNSPSLVSVFVSPTVNGGLTTGTYTGSFVVSFTSTGVTQTVTVTLTVTSATPLLVANPGVLNISCNACSTLPTTFVQVVTTDGSPLPISVASTSSGNWLAASIASTGASTPTSIQLDFSGITSLPNGINTGTVTVVSGSLTLTIPVVVLVSGSNSSGGGTLTLSASSLSFNAAVNGTAPASQTLTVSAGSTTNFTVTSTTSTGGNWLTVAPSGNLNTNQNLIVSASQAGLGAGTYSGTISLLSNGATQTVPVTLVVSTTGTGGGGNVTVSPTSLNNFSYQQNGTVPAAQSLTVSSQSGSAAIPFTAAATTNSGGNWLVVSPTSSNTSATVSVSLSASVVSSLSAGTYNGNVVITPSGGTVVSLPVTLTVTAAPTVSATPTSLTFAYQSGGNTPSPGSINVTGSTAGLSFTATSSTLNGGNWLSISPSSGTTNGTVTVSLNPSVVSSLVAGTYNGTVTVSGSGTATGSTTTNVTLTVTAPLPTITAVVSAASFASSPAVSPGEIVSIGGTALGPVSGVSLTLDSSGKVSTLIGGVQVLFNGFPAPLIYVSSNQINCVVPYEVAGSISPFVQVKYLGQTSNAWPLQQAVAVPALFTANSGGTGPGAILNQDGSFNSQRPAPKGSTVVVYMTGEGQTSPGGVTGKVTTANTSGVGAITPAPLLPVSALIGGQPALVTFAGEAPGLVTGVLQVNVVVPATASSGNLPISISIGTISSQQGVTVSVQ